jgi:hypothetical protein
MQDATKTHIGGKGLTEKEKRERGIKSAATDATTI